MNTYLFIGLTILAIASARVVRQAPKEDILNEATESDLQDVDKFVQDLTGVNTEELRQKADQYLELLITQIQLWADKLDEETKKNEIIQEVRKKIGLGIDELLKNVNLHVDKFKEEQPDTYNQITQHVETLKSTSSAVVGKIEELANSEDAKRLQESTIKVVYDIVKLLRDGVPISSFLSEAKPVNY